MAAKRSASERFAAVPSVVSFQADLLCDGQNNVVYMEANSDFVEALSQAMHMSVGGLALSMQRFEADIGPVHVIKGLQGLRDELWDGDKAAMLPATASMTSTTKTKDKPPATSCQLCQQMDGADGEGFERYLTNQFARPGNTSVTILVANPPNLRGGIPIPGVELPRGPTNFQQIPACLICQRDAKIPDCRRCHCTHCSRRAQTFFQQYQRSGMQVARVETDAVPKPAIKSTVKFIVTNKLEVFENSSIRAIQLLGKAGVALDQIQTRSVAISQEQFKMMLGCMLLNSDTILTTCLTNPDETAT
jgi:hypothetical protein